MWKFATELLERFTGRGARAAAEQAAKEAAERAAAEQAARQAAQAVSQNGGRVILDGAGKPLRAIDEVATNGAAQGASEAATRAGVDAVQAAIPTAGRVSHWAGRGFITDSKMTVGGKLSALADDPRYTQKILDRIRIRGGLSKAELDEITNLRAGGGIPPRVADEAIAIKREYERLGKTVFGFAAVPARRAMEFGRYVRNNPLESLWVAGAAAPAKAALWVAGLPFRVIGSGVKDIFHLNLIKGSTKIAAGGAGLYAGSQVLPDSVRQVAGTALSAAGSAVQQGAGSALQAGGQALRENGYEKTGDVVQGLGAAIGGGSSRQAFNGNGGAAPGSSPQGGGGATQDSENGGVSTALWNMITGMFSNHPFMATFIGASLLLSDGMTSRIINTLVWGAIGYFLDRFLGNSVSQNFNRSAHGVPATGGAGTGAGAVAFNPQGGSGRLPFGAAAQAGQTSEGTTAPAAPQIQVAYNQLAPQPG